MINMLKGVIETSSGSDVTLMVGGVGFLVHVPSGVCSAFEAGQEILLHTSMIVREDSMDLYGFVDTRQKEIFSLLLNVSGVGPKTAMNIVSSIEPNMFLEEVAGENINYLCTLPGIGKKSAQRIVLELKEKISKTFSTAGGGEGQKGNVVLDAVAALVALGYSERQSMNAVKSVKAGNVEDTIRLALKELT